ncbi:MAG: YfbU family protein, partial [Acidobacteriaceae bacterium]
MAITLSRTERLILANQFQILATLKPDEADNYSSLIEIAERGFSERYGDLFSGIHAEELSPEECAHVGRVLEMFWNLQDSVDQLEAPEELKADDVIFPGFDGNNELEFV